MTSSTPPPEDPTTVFANLLRRAGEADSEDRELVLERVYTELRRLASLRMSSERADHTLQATALVHEAYLRLLGDRQALDLTDERKFFGAAAGAMRRILLDHARKKGRQRRGGGHVRIELDALALAQEDAYEELLAVEDGLTALRDVDPRAAEIVSMRFYTGMSEPEVAQRLGLSESTVRRERAFAQAWLRRKLGNGDTPGTK